MSKPVKVVRFRKLLNTKYLVSPDTFHSDLAVFYRI